MEQFTRMLMSHLVSKGMEVTSIPAFIRNVANTIVANPSMSLEDLNSHIELLGWDNFELDDYTFCFIIATFEPDLACKPTYCFDPTLNHQHVHKLSDEKEHIPTLQIDNNKPLQEQGMEPTKANPIRKRGERNIYCPFYNDCLDYAVKHYWQYWSCTQCPHKVMQSITECEYEVTDP